MWPLALIGAVIFFLIQRQRSGGVMPMAGAVVMPRSPLRDVPLVGGSVFRDDRTPAPSTTIISFPTGTVSTPPPTVAVTPAAYTNPFTGSTESLSPIMQAGYNSIARFAGRSIPTPVPNDDRYGEYVQFRHNHPSFDRVETFGEYLMRVAGITRDQMLALDSVDANWISFFTQFPHLR